MIFREHNKDFQYVFRKQQYYMRLKLKQSNNNAKFVALPPLRHNQASKLTPRYKSNTKSFPKIISSCVSSKEDNSILYNYKKYKQQKTINNQKPKDNYKKKKKHEIIRIKFDVQRNNQSDEANITSNFQKEIQKNLKLIKQEKENKKKAASLQKNVRYRSSTEQNQNTDSSLSKIHLFDNYSQNLINEDNVFTKINQIIVNNQSKSSNLVNIQGNHTPQSILDSYKFNNEQTILSKKSRPKFKTQISQIHPESLTNKRSNDLIKNDDNYHEWRKLSIDSMENSKLSYNVSSYEMQTDRLQKIRIKNDLSLKKYFEGKSYLKKLKNYRQSSLFLPTKQ